ncbi:MAG: ZPR1 zinc finger domain-containing protein [Promethearchaeota archaeon]|nr:MAG: ZPR1 zinc finger domain-containing protein [Candidatus Lokiarchaeota archaeon]
MSEKAKKSEEEFYFQCPVCKKGKIAIRKTVYDLPDKDKMLIIRFECNNCDYSANDVIPLTTNLKSGVHILQIKDEEDLKSKVYRSPVGRLEIPELELIIEPGPSATFYYTNIEGILLKFENAVSIYKRNLETNDPQVNEVEEILNNIQKALSGEFQFTLKLSDAQGGSYIIPQNESNYSFKAINDQQIQ